MNEWQPAFEFTRTFGFPAAVAGFVLWRMEKTMRDLIMEIKAFREITAENTESLERHISATADRIIRESDHNLRTALIHTMVPPPAQRRPER